MIRDTITSDSFIVGRALPPDSPTYVKRSADDELFQLALAGQFSYVLAPRQMGKSSLMIHTAQRLRTEGVSTALLYLSGSGARVSAEQWYLALIIRLKLQLKLSIDPDKWWAKQTSGDPVRRFTDFLHDVVLAEIKAPVVIFIDEIETTRNLKFSDGFFATIRSIYDARETDSTYKRLTFVLLGIAIPEELIKAPDRSPFNIGHEINLCEFSQEEAQVLQQNLQAICPNQAEPIFSRIFYWTNGHPYLTQKLCLNVAKLREHGSWTGHGLTNQKVDWLVERHFLSTAAREEPNLQFVRESIENSSGRRRLLNLYRRVYVGKKVAEDRQSFDQNRLKLFGLVRAKKGTLKTRNHIYRRAFNLDWIKTNKSFNANWVRAIVLIAVLLIFLLAGGAGYSFYQQRQEMAETQAQDSVERFRNTTNPDVRLTSLAVLLSLTSHEDQAQQLFYEELDPADQLELFELTDPKKRGEELITVVRGLYTNPTLENNEQDNALLKTMAQALREMDHTLWLSAIDLELEITNWLKGRGYYDQGQYRQAVEAYNVTIDLNEDNLGTYYDRSLAYAALGEPSRGLDDLATILSADERWQKRVQQALLTEPQLYTALWTEQGDRQTLVALVPTPTGTPSPTITPAPSPTPLPTDTPQPRRPTSTSTPTSTPTSSISAPPPTSTPTPGLPTGTFTLLKPLSLDDPTFGPTNFEWQWTGPVPPGYGFEVRVWREGEQPAGVHNAVLDNQNGLINNIGDNTYSFSANIKGAAGVRGHSGIYLWTVALVQISPDYADLGQQAAPARLRFEITGGSDGGQQGEGGDGSGSSGGGGGVGID